VTVNVNGYGDTAEYLGPAEVPGEATPTRSVVLVYHPVAIAECCCAGLEASTASHRKGPGRISTIRSAADGRKRGIHEHPIRDNIHTRSNMNSGAAIRLLCLREFNRNGADHLRR